jgi:hypothetical protein
MEDVLLLQVLVGMLGWWCDGDGYWVAGRVAEWAALGCLLTLARRLLVLQNPFFRRGTQGRPAPDLLFLRLLRQLDLDEPS